MSKPRPAPVRPERRAAQRPGLEGRSPDDTRLRLLATAKELFADRGLDGVTVRELCSAAGANVAAVNYHFGDKLGLYAAVIEEAIALMKETTGPGGLSRSGPPEERLAAYVRFQLERLLTRPQGSWVSRLMNREMERPTAALDRLVREAIKPRMEYLGAIAVELLRCPPSDPRVAVASSSVHAQIMLLSRTAVASRMAPGWKATPESIAQLAALVARYALGGIRALGEGGR